MVAGFTVVDEVQALQLFIMAGAQAHDDLDDEDQHQGADTGQGDGEPDGLDLLQPQGLAYDVLEVQVEVGVDGRVGQETGEQGAQGSAHAVDAEGIQGVVVLEPVL